METLCQVDRGPQCEPARPVPAPLSNKVAESVPHSHVTPQCHLLSCCSCGGSGQGVCLCACDQEA